MIYLIFNEKLQKLDKKIIFESRFERIQKKKLEIADNFEKIAKNFGENARNFGTMQKTLERSIKFRKKIFNFRQILEKFQPDIAINFGKKESSTYEKYCENKIPQNVKSIQKYFKKIFFVPIKFGKCKKF